MKPQQLISAGFAITAFVAASIPALGTWDPPALIDTPAQPVVVAMGLPDPAD